ncbi:Proteasome activator subunit 4 [Ananas comosus]|uniref:Proteasome activator subunit 4 n=1 Tax=Ananas comosus TaxID=4615 RepID=A0A199VMW9_ANACO|nr:Proteasome activator subunit 4 [Ananas comosus]
MPSRSRGTWRASIFYLSALPHLRLGATIRQQRSSCRNVWFLYWTGLYIKQKNAYLSVRSSVEYVREAVGVMLSVLCSNMRLFATSGLDHLSEGTVGDAYMFEPPQKKNWAKSLTERASELSINIQNANLSNRMQSADSAHENGFTNAEIEADVKRMETLFRYIISSLKSGRSSVLLDIIVGLLYPVLSLQEMHGWSNRSSSFEEEKKTDNHNESSEIIAEYLGSSEFSHAIRNSMKNVKRLLLNRKTWKMMASNRRKFGRPIRRQPLPIVLFLGRCTHVPPTVMMIDERNLTSNVLLVDRSAHS